MLSLQWEIRASTCLPVGLRKAFPIKYRKESREQRTSIRQMIGGTRCAFERISSFCCEIRLVCDTDWFASRNEPRGISAVKRRRPLQNQREAECTHPICTIKPLRVTPQGPSNIARTSHTWHNATMPRRSYATTWNCFGVAHSGVNPQLSLY